MTKGRNMSFLEKFKQFFTFNNSSTAEKDNTKTSNVTVVTDDYSKLKVTELKKLAKERGIKGYSSLKKTQLIELLNK